MCTVSSGAIPASTTALTLLSKISWIDSPTRVRQGWGDNFAELFQDGNTSFVIRCYLDDPRLDVRALDARSIS